MKHAFHPKARKEFREAVFWYEDQSYGLGVRFTDAIEQAVRMIVSDPGRFQKLDEIVRVFRCKVYPYKLLYTWDGQRDMVRIYAVAHNRRRTDYWRERLSDW